jgi:hypothetical protein
LSTTFCADSCGFRTGWSAAERDVSRPAEIAAAIASEIGRRVSYCPVAADGADGAARAAVLLADLR